MLFYPKDQMKTINKVPYQLIEVEYIEPPLKTGIFYYSPLYRSSNHLCPCGCGDEVPVPIKDGEWKITPDGNSFRVDPSFQRRDGCKSHYVFREGKAVILK